jgi:hypothetical protein
MFNFDTKMTCDLNSDLNARKTKRNKKKKLSAFENRQTAQHFLRQKLEMLKVLSNQIA